MTAEVRARSASVLEQVSQLEQRSRAKQGEVMAVVNHMETGAKQSLAEAEQALATVQGTLTKVSKIEELVKSKVTSAEASKKQIQAAVAASAELGKIATQSAAEAVA